MADMDSSKDQLRTPEEIISALNSLLTRLFLKESNEISAHFKDITSPSQEILIDDILTAPPVLEITTDLELIKQAIISCKAVAIVNDGTAIKPIAKPEQNTIILRDMPSNISIEEVYNIFSTAVGPDGTACPPVVSARSDMNDYWFVIFNTEEDAKLALQCIKDTKIEDKNIKARLKTESSTKYFYSEKRMINPSVASTAPSNNAVNMPTLSTNPILPNPVMANIPLPPEYQQNPAVMMGSGQPFPNNLGPMPFGPGGMPPGVPNLVSGGMFFSGYPVPPPPPPYVPTFPMQGGIPMMGYVPPMMMAPGNPSKPMFVPAEHMQLQMQMQMGVPPTQMTPQGPIIFTPGPYGMPPQQPAPFVDVNTMAQSGYRPAQASTPNRDYSRNTPNASNMNGINSAPMQGNMPNNSNNRFNNPGNSYNSGGMRNNNMNNNYNSPYSQQGNQRQNSNRNHRPGPFAGGHNNQFFNNNNNRGGYQSGSGNNSNNIPGMGSDSSSHSWSEGGPSAEADGSNSSLLGEVHSSSYSSLDGPRGGLGLSSASSNSFESTNPPENNRGRTQSQQPSAGEQGGGGNRGPGSSSNSSSTFNRPPDDATQRSSNRNPAGGGGGGMNYPRGRTAGGGRMYNVASSSNNNTPESIAAAATELGAAGGDATEKGAGETTRKANSFSNRGGAGSDGDAPEEGARSNSSYATGAGKGPIGTGKDFREGKEKNRDRERMERDKEKTGRRGDKREKKGDLEKKKTVPPVAEFNFEADFPTLVDIEGSDSNHSAHASTGFLRNGPSGYANAVRKSATNEAIALSTEEATGTGSAPASPVNAAKPSTVRGSKGSAAIAVVAGAGGGGGGGGGGDVPSSVEKGIKAENIALVPSANAFAEGELKREKVPGEVERDPVEKNMGITFGAFSEPVHISNSDSLQFGPSVSGIPPSVPGPAAGAVKGKAEGGGSGGGGTSSSGQGKPPVAGSQSSGTGSSTATKDDREHGESTAIATTVNKKTYREMCSNQNHP